MGSFKRRRTRVSIHRLISGRSASRMVGRDVMKIHPRRVSAQLVAVQTLVVSLSLGSSRKLSALILREPSTPVRCCGAFGSISIQYSVPLTRRSISAGSDIHLKSIFGSLDATIDFSWIGHPFDQVFGRWQIRQEMSKYLLRGLNKKAIG